MPLLACSDSITAANTGSEYANDFEYLKVMGRISGQWKPCEKYEDENTE